MIYWFMVYGLWFIGLWFMICGLYVYGLFVYRLWFIGFWFLVSGLWFMVYGLWFMVYGLWFMVYVFWFMVYGVHICYRSGPSKLLISPMHNKFNGPGIAALCSVSSATWIIKKTTRHFFAMTAIATDSICSDRSFTVLD